MKYRFCGDVLQLIKYELTIEHTADKTIEPYIEVCEAASEEEKSELVERHPEAVVVEIDNTGYEWLDGMVFTQEQLKSGELARAIEMGEVAYKEMISLPSQEEINAMLMLEIAKLKASDKNG